MELNFSEFSPSQIYHLMTQSIIPRPIAWVLTENQKTEPFAKFNLAPFSYFSAVSSNPPLLMISVGKKDSTSDKDTSINCHIGAQAVVHIASAAQCQVVTESAATLEYGESEIDQSNLELLPFKQFDLPRIAQCPIAFGCRVYDVQKIGHTPQTLIFFEIETMFVDDQVVTEHNGRITISAEQTDPLGRLGAAQYATLGDIIKQVRPK